MYLQVLTIVLAVAAAATAQEYEYKGCSQAWDGSDSPTWGDLTCEFSDQGALIYQTNVTITENVSSDNFTINAVLHGYDVTKLSIRNVGHQRGFATNLAAVFSTSADSIISAYIMWIKTGQEISVVLEVYGVKVQENARIVETTHEIHLVPTPHVSNHQDWEYHGCSQSKGGDGDMACPVFESSASPILIWQQNVTDSESDTKISVEATTYGYDITEIIVYNVGNQLGYVNNVFLVIPWEAENYKTVGAEIASQAGAVVDMIVEVYGVKVLDDANIVSSNITTEEAPGSEVEQYHYRGCSQTGTEDSDGSISCGFKETECYVVLQDNLKHSSALPFSMVLYGYDVIKMEIYNTEADKAGYATSVYKTGSLSSDWYTTVGAVIVPEEEGKEFEMTFEICAVPLLEDARMVSQDFLPHVPAHILEMSTSVEQNVFSGCGQIAGDLNDSDANWGDLECSLPEWQYNGTLITASNITDNALDTEISVEIILYGYAVSHINIYNDGTAEDQRGFTTNIFNTTSTGEVNAHYSAVGASIVSEAGKKVHMVVEVYGAQLLIDAYVVSTTIDSHN